MIAQAESALRFAPSSDRKQGISGNLFVTNFKVCFLTADKSSYAVKEVGSEVRVCLDVCINVCMYVRLGGWKEGEG